MAINHDNVDTPPVAAQPDFWRTATQDLLPSGVADTTTGITHTGPIHFGAATTANLFTVAPLTARHEGIVGYNGNGNHQTQVIQTTIPDAATVMPLIQLRGYNYGTGDDIDIDIMGYPYAAATIANPGWVSRGSRSPTQIRFGIVGGFLAIELTWPAMEYHARYGVSAYCDGPNSAQTAAMFQGWSVTADATIAAGTPGLLVVPQRFIAPNNRPNLQAQLHLRGRAYFSEAREVRWTGVWRIFGEGLSADRIGSGGGVSLFMPTAAVPVAGGTTRALVAAGTEAVATGGIPFNDYESLWYQLRQGDTGSNAAHWLIQPYNSTSGMFGLTGPSRPDGDGWVMVCYVEGGTAYFGDASVIERGSSFAENVNVERLLNKHRQTGLFLPPSGFVFWPQSKPASLVSFGFGGAPMRCISVGREDNEIAPYIDIPVPAAGLAVYGFGNVADTAWRAIVTADNTYQFGEISTNVAASAVIDLGAWDALWWAPTPGGVTSGQWYRTNYNGTPLTVIPDNWVLICINASVTDAGTIKLWDGTGLRRGALRMGDGRAHHDALEMRRTLVNSQGRAEARLTTATQFAGTGTMGISGAGGTSGVYIGWDSSALIAGMGGTYDDTTPFVWLDLPAVGTQIPVLMGTATSGPTLTRTVTAFAGSTKKWVPLATWESLVYIGRPYSPSSNAAASGWKVVDYTQNAYLPPYAITVARLFAAPTASTSSKTRVLLGDGTYLSVGNAFAVGTPVYGDHASGATDAWRTAIAPGDTPPAGTAAFSTALAAITSNGVQFRSFTEQGVAQGYTMLAGSFTVNAAIPDNTQIIFIPSVSIRLTQYFLVAATHGSGAAPVGVARIQFINGVVGGQNGAIGFIMGYSAANITGGTYIAGGQISFDGIRLDHA